jgi:hypothetical protein
MRRSISDRKRHDGAPVISASPAERISTNSESTFHLSNNPTFPSGNLLALVAAPRFCGSIAMFFFLRGSDDSFPTGLPVGQASTSVILKRTGHEDTTKLLRGFGG